MKPRPAICALLLGALLAGCAAQNPRAGVNAPSTPLGADLFTSVLPAQRAGLEVQWWSVVDADDALGRALAPYTENESPLADRVRVRWRINGLRMVVVPLEDLNAVLSSLSITDKVNRLWLGQTTTWTVAAPGAPWEGERSLLIGGETIRMGAGQLRLLTRAWVSPTESAPTLRTDVALQYIDRLNQNPARSPLEPATLPTPEEEGLIFRTLTAPMELDPGYAYCIVAEDPDVDWAELLPEDESAESEEPRLPRRARSPFDHAPPSETGGVLGPAPPGVPLLADALLSTVELLPTRRRARSIVALIPRVPERQRLTPVGALNP